MINQYYTNPYLLNPAQAGGYDYPVAYLTYKNQWTGLNGNPSTASFTYNRPFLQSSGLGINIYNDASGFLAKTELQFSFSQTVFLDAERQYLSFGISGGIIDQHINLAQVSGETGKPIDPVASAYNTNHPIYPDFDFGLAYRYHGLFLNFVLPNLVKFTSLSPSLSSSYADLPLYFASLSYSFPIGDDFTLEPMIAAHEVQGVSNQWDISSLITYREIISLGAFYHNNQSYSISLGYLFNKTWDFNYAYTQSSSAIQQYFGGTQEISLGYHFSQGHQSRSSKNNLIRCPKLIH
jgi:type IX secretion system PorP/SprF family membrane protein